MTDVRCDFVSDSGDAERRDDIDKSGCLPGNHGDPVLGCRCYHGDKINAVLFADGIKISFFLERYIRQDNSVDSDVAAGADKFFRSVGKYHIGIGHENHRDFNILPEIPDEVKNFIRCHSSVQSPDVGFLDNRSFRGGI